MNSTAPATSRAAAALRSYSRAHPEFAHPGGLFVVVGLLMLPVFLLEGGTNRRFWGLPIEWLICGAVATIGVLIFARTGLGTALYLAIMALASGYYTGLWRAGFPLVTFGQWVEVASQSMILICGWGYGVHQVRSLRQRKSEAKQMKVGRDLQGA